MSMLNWLHKTIFAISFSLFSLCALAVVTVDINGKVSQFDSAVRLSELWPLLTDAEKVFWPLASLYVEDANLNQQRQELIAVLAFRAQMLKQHRQQDAEIIERLISQLSDWRLARRLSLPISYEKSRHVLAFNPLLPNGHYYLRAAAQNPYIELIGAVNTAQLPLTGDEIADLTDIHQRFAIDKMADNSWLFWRLGANWHRSGIAYWNKEAVQVAAGTSVFIPFSKSTLGADAQQLNQQIMALFDARVW